MPPRPNSVRDAPAVSSASHITDGSTAMPKTNRAEDRACRADADHEEIVVRTTSPRRAPRIQHEDDAEHAIVLIHEFRADAQYVRRHKRLELQFQLVTVRGNATRRNACARYH